MMVSGIMLIQLFIHSPVIYFLVFINFHIKKIKRKTSCGIRDREKQLTVVSKNAMAKLQKKGGGFRRFCVLSLSLSHPAVPSG